MTRLALAVALTLAAFAAHPVSALVPAAAPGEPATAATTPAPSIEATQEDGSDERIVRRLGGIFGELPAFGEVQVAVREGVVTLAGTVPSDADIASFA